MKGQFEGKPKILRIENKRDLPQGEGSEALRSPISEGRGEGGSILEGKSKMLRIENKWDLPIEYLS